MTVQKQLFANNASTTLSIAINGTDTQLTVANGNAFPNPNTSLGQYFLLTLESSGVIEVIKISAKSGNVFTVSGGVAGRGQEGTSANSFPLGTIVECRVTAGTLESLVAEPDYVPYLSNADGLLVPSLMSSHYYMAGVDDGSNSVPAYAISSTQWSFPTFTPKFNGNATSGSMTSMTAASVPSTGNSGQYIIQFVSGSNQGYCRLITGYGAGSVSWGTALPNAVTTDGYVIYQSNYSIISALNIGNPAVDALLYALIFSKS